MNDLLQELIDFEQLAEDAVILHGLDDCIIGTCQDSYLIYCEEMIIEHYQVEDKMNREEAIDFLYYNILGIHPQNFVIKSSY